MDAILETSPHFHNTPELSMCWGGGEPQFSRHTLRVGLLERYPCFSQNCNAKCARTNRIPGKLEVQHSLHSESAASVGEQ